MNVQSTLIKGLADVASWISALAGVLVCLAGPHAAVAATDVSLASMLSPRQAMKASGTLSVQGAMSVSGVPFDAVLHSDTILVNTGSPFGMKTSSVYARADTFVVLNFLTRQAIDGDPMSEKVSAMLPIPLGIDDIRNLIRGIPPGDLAAFEFQSSRKDGQLLYRRRDTSTVEFALIDTISHTLRQYQRKKSDGTTLLNVTYGSYRELDGVMVPFGVSVTANDEAEKVQFRFDEIQIGAPAEPLRPLSIPSSFTRVTLN